MRVIASLIIAFASAVAAFSPSSAGHFALRSSARATSSRTLSIVMGGADRIPPGPKGRGPFTEEDKFKLPDGRVYVPGDAATDGIYGAALSNPVSVPDSVKGVAAAALLGGAVLVPTFLIKVIGGY